MQSTHARYIDATVNALLLHYQFHYLHTRLNLFTRAFIAPTNAVAAAGAFVRAARADETLSSALYKLERGEKTREIAQGRVGGGGVRKKGRLNSRKIDFRQWGGSRRNTRPRRTAPTNGGPSGLEFHVRRPKFRVFPTCPRINKFTRRRVYFLRRLPEARSPL